MLIFQGRVNGSRIVGVRKDGSRSMLLCWASVISAGTNVDPTPFKIDKVDFCG